MDAAAERLLRLKAFIMHMLLHSHRYSHSRQPRSRLTLNTTPGRKVKRRLTPRLNFLTKPTLNLSSNQHLDPRAATTLLSATT